MALTNPTGFANGPAQVEVLTNPAAGSIAGTEGQVIAQAGAARVSETTSAQLVAILRGPRVIVPESDEPLEGGDELLFVAVAEVEDQLQDLLLHPQPR